MEKQSYVSRFNRVWQNIKTGEIFGNTLKLKDNEKITSYREIPKPTNDEHDAQDERGASQSKKQRKESFSAFNTAGGNES